ncbi:MAG: L-2-amino-thiazoline-4-carboxylic acid hydrolase [Lachnospiraceae bacterium]|nr:L-2-amino-thiazoline-4-carboxylic acid hydrolase [Lachnospiraceae bacterium]MCM1233660.1 L-2-amino-thiazoline-4-carboxylic acid hydrolase [Ruminococcus flavefaciens]
MNLIESKYAVSYEREMKKFFPESESGILWKTAEKEFQNLLKENPEQPKAVARHTHISIFPAIAVYKTIAANYPDKAMQILENGAAAVSKQAGRKYAKLLKFPGMKMIFLKVFSKGVKKGFGPEAGFAHEFITASSKALAFNVNKCPYQYYCEKYGCPEIVHIFCKNDEYAYGNLPYIRFTRTQTLGTGGSCCDFHFIKK